MDLAMGLDLDNYNSFLKHNGDIKGCVISIDKETFYERIIEPYKNDLKNAKAVLVEFEFSSSVSLFDINEFMTSFHNYCSSDTSLIFGTKEVSDDISIDIVVCRMLISSTLFNK